MASILMMVMGASTATGRILFGRIVASGVLNRLHMHQLSMVITGSGVMLLPLIKTFHGTMPLDNCKFETKVRFNVGVNVALIFEIVRKSGFLMYFGAKTYDFSW